MKPTNAIARAARCLRSSLRWLLLAALFTTATAQAQVDPSGTHEALVAEALRVSQTPRVIETMSQALAESMISSPHAARLKPEQRTRLAAAIARVYTPKRFLDRIRELMIEQASDDELREFIAYSQTALAQRGLEMEIAASTATVKLIEQHARSIATDPETMTRINAVTRLDAASGGTEVLLAMTVAAALSSADMQRRLSVERDGPPGSQADSELPEHGAKRTQSAKDEVERLARSLRPKVHRDVLNSALFSYRWMPLADLLSYTDLHEKPAMRKMAALINDALGSVFLLAHGEAIEEIMLEMKGKGVTPA